MKSRWGHARRFAGPDRYSFSFRYLRYLQEVPLDTTQVPVVPVVPVVPASAVVPASPVTTQREPVTHEAPLPEVSQASPAFAGPMHVPLPAAPVGTTHTPPPLQAA